MPSDPEPIPLDAATMIGALNRHGVRYLVIGGMAAVIQGAPVNTFDLDVTAEASRENLSRLALALTDLGAQLRVPGEPDPIAVPLDDRTFRFVTTMTFRTTAGDLDVSLRPDGTDGYPDLVRRQLTVMVFGHSTPVAHLDDVIRSKEAAGREKDRLVLPLLRRLQQRLAEESR